MTARAARPERARPAVRRFKMKQKDRPPSSTPIRGRSTRPVPRATAGPAAGTGRAARARSAAPGRAAPPLLLASVRDLREIRAAIAGGADIIDLKDPRRGPLGAWGPDRMRAGAAICRAAGVPVSAALGDAGEWPSGSFHPASIAAARGAGIVKVGLRGAADPERAVRFLRGAVAAARAASPGVVVVAATYAEGETAGALDPRELPGVARRAGADGCLLDTFSKDGRSLLDLMPIPALEGFVAGCRTRGLVCALAGSLGAREVASAARLGADVLGARGALCAGGRTGRLETARVRRFRVAITRGADGGGPRARASPFRSRPPTIQVSTPAPSRRGKSGSTMPRRARSAASARP